MVTSNTDMDSVKHIHTLWSCISEIYLQNRDRVKSIPNKYDNLRVITYTSLTFKAECLKTTKFISVYCAHQIWEKAFIHIILYVTSTDPAIPINTYCISVLTFPATDATPEYFTVAYKYAGNIHH